MNGPKQRLRGVTDLGRAVDERVAAGTSKLDLRHGAGKATASTLGGGGSGGGGGGSGTPAFPEGQVQYTRQTFWAAGNADGGAVDINLHWQEAAVEESMPAPAVTALSRCAFDTDADEGPGALGESYAHFSWTPQVVEGELISQCKLLVGAPCRRFGDSANAAARVRLNSAGHSAAFAAAYLALGDGGANCAVTANLIPALSAGSWDWLELNGVDIAGWGGELRITLTAVGTLEPGDAGLCRLDVEQLAIEQLAG